MKRKLFYIIMILVFVMSLTSAASAQQGGLSPVPGSITPGSTFSLELNKESKPATPAQPQSRAAQAAGQFRVVPLIVTFDSSVDAQQLAAATGGTVTHTFSKIFNGASLVVPSQNVAAVQSYPGVTKVVVSMSCDSRRRMLALASSVRRQPGRHSAGRRARARAC